MARTDPPRDHKGRFDVTQEERDHRISFRVTKSEYQAILEEARAAGVTPTDYGRKRVLGQRVISRTDREMIALLNKLGGLQKIWFNELNIAPEKTAHILDQMGQAVHEIVTEIRARKDEGEER